MPGPLTTEARVRELGGLDDSQAFNLFRLANDAALSARITTEISIASAWLQSRGGSDYASGDVVKDTLFAEAEAYLSLQNLYETLKMRKVVGSHFPLFGEEAKSFEELIDVEMPSHIQKFIDAYVAVPEKDEIWAAPAMALSTPIDRQGAQQVSQVTQMDTMIDEATELAVPVFPLTTDGQQNTI